jgi:hypothetical protein
MLWGALFGLVFSAILVAIPFSTNVLTFGVAGTLLVGAVECAVIAGGFAALAAALFANGVRGVSTAQFEHILKSGRRTAVAGPRDVAVAEWPTRWAYPARTAVTSFPQSPEAGLISAFSASDVPARPSGIDAWENGNAGSSASL